MCDVDTGGQRIGVRVVNTTVIIHVDRELGNGESISVDRRGVDELAVEVRNLSGGGCGGGCC